jgi:hypothetical protein
LDLLAADMSFTRFAGRSDVRSKSLPFHSASARHPCLMLGNRDAMLVTAIPTFLRLAHSMVTG